MRRITIAASFVLLAVAAGSARADVSVGIHIGVPPPAYTFEAPPHVVVVPGVPDVRYAPDVGVNFFTYGDRYYTYDDGSWFVAHDGRGPWAYVEPRYVPAPVLRVPSRYYRVPPRLVGGGHWNQSHGKARYHHGRHDGRGGKHDKHNGGKHGRGGGKDYRH